MSLNYNQLHKFILVLLLLCVPCVLHAAETVDTFIQGGHSGAWYASDQSGHGLFAEVLEDTQAASGKRLLVAWFAFIDGRQVWLLATGEITREGDGQVAHMTAWIYEGNDFPPLYDPSQTLEIVWGEISMRFTGCDHAQLSWISIIEGYGSGQLQLERLTTIAGSTCDPDFGGDEKPDDHGDTWQTGTHFATHTFYNDSIEGKLESREDIDVFLFTLLDGQSVAIFTISSIGTSGTLYRIDGFKETELATDDDDGIFANFLIQDLLGPGNYSIHVTGDNYLGAGEYTLWLQTQP